MSASNLTAEPIVIVRLEQPRCILSHGLAPCTALGTPCYNTFSTCEDRPNYTEGATLDLYFGLPGQPKPTDDIQVLPFLADAPETTAARVNISGADRRVNPLGIRASATIRFYDSAHDDQRVDPYRDVRGGDPEKLGTFWSKWYARNTFGRSRMRVSIFEGFAGDALADMVHRLYFADKFDMSGEGRVTLTCKDVFAQAADAKAPRPSPGELHIDLNQTDMSLRLARATLADYPASGTLRINNECMTYSAVAEASDGFLDVTLTARGTDGTEASDHEAEDPVQECLRLENLTPDAALLALYAFTPVSLDYLPSSDWLAEAAQHQGAYRLDGLVTEPTDVDRLIGRVLETVQGVHWWDDENKQARYLAIKPLSDVPRLLTEDENLIAGTVRLRDFPERRVSRVYVYHTPRDATEDVEERSNYSRVTASIDPDAEASLAYGEPALREIFAPYLRVEPVAFEGATRILRRYREGVRELQFAVPDRDGSLQVGDMIRVRHHRVQKTDGTLDLRLWMITSRKPVRSDRRVIYTAEDAVLAGQVTLIAEDSVGNYIGDGSDPAGVGWISDDNGLLPNGDPGFTIE